MTLMLSRSWLSLLIVIAVAPVTCAQSTQPLALPTSGFISGRAATKQDVGDRNATFAIENNGLVLGKPIAIAIPQFAYWTDETGNKKVVVVVQAEEAPNGMRIFGFRDHTGQDAAGLESEFELLGTSPPIR